MKTKIKMIYVLFLLFLINMNIYANENTTTINVSNMSTGENVIHDHVYQSQYDDENHWTECLVCHDKLNVTKHTITTTWALGSASCHKSNYATKTCSCGYSTVYKKPCVWKGSYGTNANVCYHEKTCSVCGCDIKKPYYKNTYGSGTLYPAETAEDCKTSNGTRITCKNGGTCAICKQTKSKGTHYLTASNNNIICKYCGVNYGTYSVTSTPNGNTPALYTTTIKLSLKNGATFSSAGSLRNLGSAYSSQSNSHSANSAKTSITITYKSQMSTTYKVQYSTYASIYLLIGGKSCLARTASWYQPIETTKPTITTMETNDVNFAKDDWVLSKKVTIKGVENYTNTVSINVVDEKGVVAYSGTTTVSNKNYGFEFVPKIEANEVEKTYTISVTDANNNTITKELVVKKVDQKEPTFVLVDNENLEQSDSSSNNNIIVEKSDWAKSKSYDLYFSDDGIGNVAIGINNYDDITLADYDENTNAYKRNYTFIGDAYEPVNCIVYAKDGLGNLSTTTLVLDKIDNTSPTIETIDKEINEIQVLSAVSDDVSPQNDVKTSKYASITITANDINEKLGLEGSGVVKYGIKSFETNESGEDVGEIVWYETNEIEITQNGTYYIYAMDYVGNVSTPMLLVIDELTSDEDNRVNVYVTQASSFSVTIPKTIILSGETKSGAYKIYVKGNIGGLDTISVVPDNLLALSQFGKKDILASVTQEKTIFDINDNMTNDNAATTNGNIIAQNMTAGSWSGSFNFSIKFNAIGTNSSIGSIVEDATNDTIVGNDYEQDKHTIYTYGVENIEDDEKDE